LFERVGGDLVVRMMESLAEYYYAQGQHEEAIIAYHVLMDKNRNSDRLCDYQYWVTQCRMAQASTAAEAGRGVTSAGAKDLIVEEIRNMIKVWQLFVVETGPQRSATARQTCTWWAADFAIDTAVRWHREAAGSDTQPGTNDRNTMAKAAELYQLFLENFGDRTSAFYYDTLEPPPEWEYQNPYSVYKAHYYAAELLWKAEQWEACGQAFDSVVQADPAGEYAQEAAYASVLCYKKLYDQQYEAVQRVLRSDTGERAQTARDRQRAQARGAGSTWGTSIPASREFTPQEGAMEQAFHRYICYIEQGEDLANVKFNRAFLYLDANRWQEAAALFKQISAEYRGAADSDDRRIAVLSAMNYFEIIVRLKRAGVEQCTPEILAATAEILDGQFPTAGDAAVLENADERSSLTIYLEAVPVLHCAQMLLQVKDLTEQRKWELAAELAVKIHDEFPQTYPGYRCLDNDGQDMMDDILNEAANYFEAANKIMRAIGLRNRLVQEHPDSSHVANAQFGVAQAYARLAFFDRAAQEYEAFARNRATGREADERAPEAMLNAVQIRIGLGQDDQAKADAEFLDQRFGSNRKYQRKAAEAYFQIGELYTSVRNWTQVISHYDEYLRKFGRKGGKEFEVRANMLVAGAYWEQARCAPDEEDDARLRRCRTNKDKAFEYAQKANGLVTLPTFRDPEPDSPEAQIDPGELRLQRRQATWAALVEALDLEIEEEDPAAREAITFARGGKVADAIGQARFYIGEKIYEQFLRIAWPAFEPDDWNPSGGVVSTCIASMGLPRNICVSMEKYKMWTERKFVPFARDRNDKINEARRYYDSIAYLEVPTWEIAAASRVGDMYLQFWRDMYNAPTPPAFRRPEFMEVENAYREALDNNAQIYKDQAIEAFSYCLMTATREQWFNEFSQRCEAALFEIDPGRYRVSFEVYPSPALNRLHYAPPDLDLSLITSVGELGERVVAVPPVPGVPTINDQGRYRFHRQPEEAPAAAAPAAE
jgi:TolA-binding protein